MGNAMEGTCETINSQTVDSDTTTRFVITHSDESASASKIATEADFSGFGASV